MSAFSLRRSASRGRMDLGWLQARFSFSFGPYRDPERERFGALLALNEDCVQPGKGFAMHPHDELEILMLPLAGAISHRDSLGNQAIVLPGELLYMRDGTGIAHSQMNGAAGTIDHHLQVWLAPRQRGCAPNVVHRRFPDEGRMGRWQLLASADGREGSIAIGQDAGVQRAVLCASLPLGYAPAPGRSIYLHLMTGAAYCRSEGGGVRLEAGDALAWEMGQPFSLTAAGEGGAELLLLELPPLV